MEKIGEIILGVMLILMFTLIAWLVAPSKSDKENSRAWKEVIEHSDDFTYSHISSDGERACFKLFDKDGKYLCEAVIYLDEGYTNIFRSTSIILSRYSNERLSHTMFKLLYPRIPEDDLHKFLSNDELIRRLKEMQ